jgi:ribosomal protein S18 acetylase RimI-like enzyme
MLHDLRLRAMRADDIESIGHLLHEVTSSTHRDQGLLEPIADAASAMQMVRPYLDHDPAGAVLAEVGGELVGAGFVHRRGGVAAIGPVVVATAWQAQGIGKRLVARLVEVAGDDTALRACVDSFARGAIGIAMAHDLAACDTALQMAALGGLRGPGCLAALDPLTTRALTVADLDALGPLEQASFGGERRGDLERLIGEGEGLVAIDGDSACGYLIGRVEEALGILGPGVADSPQTMAALVARLGEQLGDRANILRTCLLASQVAVVRQAFAMGLRITSSSTLLCRGDDRPYGIPSVLGLPHDVV